MCDLRKNARNNMAATGNMNEVAAGRLVTAAWRRELQGSQENECNQKDLTIDTSAVTKGVCTGPVTVPSGS